MVPRARKWGANCPFVPLYMQAKGAVDIVLEFLKRLQPPPTRPLGGNLFFYSIDCLYASKPFQIKCIYMYEDMGNITQEASRPDSSAV